jgi:hypothetical protein
MLVTPSLRELQQTFAAAVYEDAPAVLAHVRDGMFPAARHLQVYRHNIFTNLTDALAAVYPVVRRLVGAGFFEYAADSYIRQHPPRSGNLHDFGAAFPDFLASFAPAQSLAYLPDVAQLEWVRQEAYHAPDAAALALNELAAVAPEHYAGLVFRLHPSVRLLASAYPILRIWQVNQPDFDSDPMVNLDEGAQRLLVVRRGLNVEIEALGAGEYALLHSCAETKTLAQARAAALDADPAFDLTHTLHRHVAAATLVRVTESSNPT